MDMLLEFSLSKQVVGIAAHGKTTTSAMIAWILKQAGKDPTYLIAGILETMETHIQATAVLQ